MRLAIISDIHANLEAFEAVLRKIDDIKPDNILCLGDIVGYGPNPNECLQKVKKIVDVSVVGNHEYGVLGLTDLRYFSVNARLACEWTKDVLTDDNMSYLSNLPIQVVREHMLLVHSTPKAPEEWNYILSIQDAFYQFNDLTEKVCLIGHSHEPITFTKGNETCGIIDDKKFLIKEDSKYIINCGSVGQPRDNDPRASFCLINEEKEEVQIIRVPYDIDKVQRKIIERGLPRFLAERLSIGV
ncbi:metallophosphoesterase family protein [candidate division WOR-3 bacterium]|nr:metallophosphoesterase family protein [candidate division WOR-3 bacterium]